MANGRKVVDARADSKGNITHVKIDGNQRFTPLNQAINMADRGELSNAHAVRPSNAKDYLRTNPDGKSANNLDTMAGDD
jgi:hypothetical protein